MGAGGARSGICGAVRVWIVEVVATDRMAQVASVADVVLVAGVVVPGADGDCVVEADGDSADPVQLRRFGGDAFCIVSVGYDLLRAARGVCGWGDGVREM